MTYYNHSGGALGADSAWDDIGKIYGFNNHNHYYHGSRTPKGNIRITDEDLKEGIEEIKKTFKILGRPDIPKYYSLLGRNWFQVKNCEAVFAISAIISPGEFDKKGYKCKALKPVVEGGTGYAVEIAIQNDKTVFVFNQRETSFKVGWYVWDSDRFKPIETPVLTQNYAGIGSRELNPLGLKAIEQTYIKTKS